MGLSYFVQSCSGDNSFRAYLWTYAVLPVEFLVPTLRVAKELEWTGRELSSRIDELEKLDETRLLAIVGMYAQNNMLQLLTMHHSPGKPCGSHLPIA